MRPGGAALEVEGEVEWVAGVAVEGEGAMMTIIMGAEAMAGMTATTEEVVVAAAAAGTRAGEGPTGAAEAVLAAAEAAEAAEAAAGVVAWEFLPPT